MKPPELTDEQYHALDAIWGNPGKEVEHKHIGWFFWLQFEEHDGNSGVYASMSEDFKMHEFYPISRTNNPNWFGDVFHQDGTKVPCKTIEDYLNELGKMWMITGRKWDKRIVGYGYKKAYIEI